MNPGQVIGRTWAPRPTRSETFVLLNNGKAEEQLRFPSEDGRTPRRVVRLSVPVGLAFWSPFLPDGYKPAEALELKFATLFLVDQFNKYLVRSMPLYMLRETVASNEPSGRFFAGIVPSWERSYISVLKAPGIFTAFPLHVEYLDPEP